MNDSRFSRRTVLGGTAGAAFAVTLTRVLPTSAQATPEAADTSPVAEGGFPVTISHVYGETTFESAPERVITISWINQDAAIALGTIPVGMPFVAWGGDEDGFLPWTREAIGDNPPPVLYDDSAGLPFEQFVELAPDAIIGVYSGMTQEEYDTLSQIAPTVAYPALPFGTSWEETTQLIGQILGKGDEAAALVDATIADVEAAGAANPQLAGKTFAYGSPSETGLYVYTTIDARVKLLTHLGLEPSSFVQNLPVGDDQSAFFVDISNEQLGEIDADILILWFGTQDEADAVAGIPTIQGIEAYANGAYAPIIGETEVMAVSAPSPLSIPYILETYVPQLVAAAENVPAE
ncbi:MAG: ABC transporter substrate-binding protein [Thermomicrobiales bacterium]|nr:ABC transporter substrate-binding protein [Thermomicrobiales bacterium]MCO5222984.1 ABC transporter substrate-binding protein [Thermomicrobiales bacterium]